MKILFQGDSITETGRDKSDPTNLGVGYPKYAAEKIAARHPDIDFTFYNLGISGTLLSGDCLQLNGIRKYRNNIVSPELYARSVEKLKTMHIQKIAAAHEFEPLGSIAEGDATVQEYLEMCLHFSRERKSMV